MRAGAELDIFLPVLHPVQYRHIGGNAEIAGDVEHPQLASRVGELGVQIANVGIVELAEIDLGPLRSIVPPDRVGIPFDQFEESLDDGFLDACCRPRSRWNPPGRRQGRYRKNTAGWSEDI